MFVALDAPLSPFVQLFEMLLLLAEEDPMDRFGRNWGKPSVRYPMPAFPSKNRPPKNDREKGEDEFVAVVLLVMRDELFSCASQI